MSRYYCDELYKDESSINILYTQRIKYKSVKLLIYHDIFPL